MLRPNDSIFVVKRKSQLFLAALLIVQTALIAVILLRIGDAAPQRPVRNAVEPCIYRYTLQPDGLERDGGHLPYPIRVSGRA